MRGRSGRDVRGPGRRHAPPHTRCAEANVPDVSKEEDVVHEEGHGDAVARVVLRDGRDEPREDRHDVGAQDEAAGVGGVALGVDQRGAADRRDAPPHRRRHEAAHRGEDQAERQRAQDRQAVRERRRAGLRVAGAHEAREDGGVGKEPVRQEQRAAEAEARSEAVASAALLAALLRGRQRGGAQRHVDDARHGDGEQRLLEAAGLALHDREERVGSAAVHAHDERQEQAQQPGDCQRSRGTAARARGQVRRGHAGGNSARRGAPARTDGAVATHAALVPRGDGGQQREAHAHAAQRQAQVGRRHQVRRQRDQRREDVQRLGRRPKWWGGEAGAARSV